MKPDRTLRQRSFVLQRETDDFATPATSGWLNSRRANEISQRRTVGDRVATAAEPSWSRSVVSR
jgi:hypothetical protein